MTASEPRRMVGYLVVEPVVVKKGGQLSDYPTDVTPWADYLAYKARIEGLLRRAKNYVGRGRGVDGEWMTDEESTLRAAIDAELGGEPSQNPSWRNQALGRTSEFPGDGSK